VRNLPGFSDFSLRESIIHLFFFFSPLPLLSFHIAHTGRTGANCRHPPPQSCPLLRHLLSLLTKLPSFCGLRVEGWHMYLSIYS
jgi:hypothetical protein